MALRVKNDQQLATAPGLRKKHQHFCPGVQVLGQQVPTDTATVPALRSGPQNHSQGNSGPEQAAERALNARKQQPSPGVMQEKNSSHALLESSFSKRAQMASRDSTPKPATPSSLPPAPVSTNRSLSLFVPLCGRSGQSKGHSRNNTWLPL